MTFGGETQYNFQSEKQKIEKEKSFINFYKS